jgi:hypothetical protein
MVANMEPCFILLSDSRVENPNGFGAKDETINPNPTVSITTQKNFIDFIATLLNLTVSTSYHFYWLASTNTKIREKSCKIAAKNKSSLEIDCLGWPEGQIFLPGGLQYSQN